MSDPCLLKATDAHFESNFADEAYFKGMISDDPQLAFGYLEATEHFCEVVAERIEKAKSFEELKAQLLSLVTERQAFIAAANPMFP